MQCSKYVEDLFDFSLQVHFNNEKTVHQISGDVQTKLVTSDDVATYTTLEDTIDNGRRTPLRLPLYLQHKTLYDRETAQENFAKKNEMYNDTTEYGEDSCAKVFMQLMCPSCCKGLFSETKGSVYMKRKSTLKSETKSVTMTICSELDDGVKSVISMEAGATGALSSNRTHSPIPEESEDKITEKEPDSMVFTAPKNEIKPKLVRDKTFEEDMNVTDRHGVLQKHRSMSLSETISNTIQEELCQNLQYDDDTANAKWYNNKLRKTSFPNSNGNGHSRNDQKVGLKIGGKDYVEIEKQENENEPPFNFQAVLRKTNTTRLSLRRSSDLSGKQNFEPNDFVAELLPGIVLRGIAYDL